MKRILIFSLLFVMVFAAWPMTAGAEGPPAEDWVTPGPASAIQQAITAVADGGELFQTIEVIHDDGTTEYYDTIPAAVNAAPAGAIVRVYPGEYNLSSQLSITKPLTLRGPNWNNNPTGGGARGPEAVITGPDRAVRVRSSDVTIEGFTFSTEGTAIWVYGTFVQNLVMSCNIFDGNREAFGTSGGPAGNPNRIRDLGFFHNVVTNNSDCSFSHYTGNQVYQGYNFRIVGNEFVDVQAGIHLRQVEGAVIHQNTFILNNQDSWAIRLLDRVGEIQIAENRFLRGGAAVLVWETAEVFDWVEIVDNVINDQSIAGIHIRQTEGSITDATKFTVAGNTFSETPVLISNEGTGKVNAPDNLVSCSADETTVQINFAELEDDSSVQLVRENELEIELPAAALPGNVEVSVKKVDGDAPEGFKFIGSVYSFTMTAEDGSAVSEFLGKVTMVFHYDPADVDDPDNLDVYWYNPDTGKWVAQNGTVDTERCTVTIEVDHWSEYALMEAESEEEDGLPKTGTNIDWLIPLGLLLLVAGAFVWRRHLAAGTGELA